MPQGMDRNKPQERRPTARIAKPGEPSTKKVPTQTKPATTRMSAAGAAPRSGGTSRAERAAERAEQQGRAQTQPTAQEGNKSTLYIALGGGALVLVLLLAFMVGGSGESGSGGGGNYETIINRAIAKAQEDYQRGEYRAGLDLCEEALKDPRAHRSSRYQALQTTATMCRSAVNLDHDAQVKVAEFHRKIEAAKADQTAMKRANEFWDECLGLLGQFGATTSGKELRGIKEDLGRWVNTERQGDWQKDYNITKGRIEKTFLGEQKFAEAIREWQRFGETSQDPLLHSRIEQEIRTINQQAQASAEKAVADAGTGADARSKLEDVQQRFNGTDGQGVINKALKALK